MKLTPIVGSTFTSDGGAMFGLVPKPMWAKRCPPNEQNAIPQRANNLLVELEDGTKGLVDTGCGNPLWHSEHERALHNLEAEWLLPRALKALGVGLEEISFICLTHAHWDHAGALVTPDQKPVFPNARLYLHECEFHTAISGNPVLYKSYPLPVTDALQTLRHRTCLVSDEDPEPFPGLRFVRTGGHTEGHCSLVFQRPTLTGSSVVPPLAVYAGDVCPTQHHLRLVFQAAYDTYPLDTRRWKMAWLPRCVDENLLLLFSHDAEIAGAWLDRDPRQEYKVRQTYSP